MIRRGGLARWIRRRIGVLHHVVSISRARSHRRFRARDHHTDNARLPTRAARPVDGVVVVNVYSRCEEESKTRSRFQKHNARVIIMTPELTSLQTSWSSSRFLSNQIIKPFAKTAFDAW